MTRIGSIGVCTVVDRNEPLAYYVSLALLRPNTMVFNSKYLKYAIESLHGRKELRKRTLVNAVPIKVNKDDIGKITIPAPPMEVQQEIVRILDSFTELTAELTARKKQYEYYRDELLTDNKNATWMTLGDIGNVCMCKRIMKAETSSEGDVPFFKIGTFGKEPDAYISREKFDEYRQKYSFPKKGDVLISAAGTIGRAVIYDGEPAYYQDSNIVWLDNDENKVLNKYLFYYYQLPVLLLSITCFIIINYSPGLFLLVERLPGYIMTTSAKPKLLSRPLKNNVASSPSLTALTPSATT